MTADSDGIDIDALYENNTSGDVSDIVNTENVMDNYKVEVYDEDNKLVDTVEFDGYEGQVAVTAAGTASYYLLSAAISIIIAYHGYTVYKSAKARTKKEAPRGKGQTIDKNRVPGKKSKHKTKTGTSLSTTGEPNSSCDLKNSNTGKITQRRFYDENGNACLDVDFSHGGNHTFPHIHIWHW